MNFGDRLEELRDERGWTQRELADKVGVSERTYQLWRSGRTEPYGKHKRRLAEVLNVPLASLTDESGETIGQLDRMERKLDELLAR
jgi:transcriptional regulator with XRE-family HTH domain